MPLGRSRGVRVVWIPGGTACRRKSLIAPLISRPGGCGRCRNRGNTQWKSGDQNEQGLKKRRKTRWKKGEKDYSLSLNGGLYSCFSSQGYSGAGVAMGLARAAGIGPSPRHFYVHSPQLPQALCCGGGVEVVATRRFSGRAVSSSAAVPSLAWHLAPV